MKNNSPIMTHNGYIDSIKTQFDEVTVKLQAKRDDLAIAASRLERERERLQKLNGPESKFMDLDSSQRRTISDMQSQVTQLERVIRDIQNEHRSLADIVSAPARLSEIKTELHDLSVQQQQLQERRQKNDMLIDKVSQRVSALQDELAVQTRAAPQQQNGNDKPFEVPASLVKLETESRLAQAALADLKQQGQDIADAIKTTRDKTRDIENAFLYARAAVCEIEMLEQLRPLMKFIARAALTKQQVSPFGNTSEMRIPIDSDLLQPMQEELSAEFAALA